MHTPVNIDGINAILNKTTQIISNYKLSPVLDLVHASQCKPYNRSNVETIFLVILKNHIPTPSWGCIMCIHAYIE